MRIKNFQNFLESKNYRYGCVMVYLDIPNWNEITSFIEKEDLYKPEDRKYGIQNNPHVTILYGLHSDVKDEDVINIFENIKSNDIKIKVDKIDSFNNEEFEVIKMNVESKKLVDLNKELTKLPHTTDYPDYKPHITLAYLLPGRAQKYIQNNYNHTFENIKKIIYSKSNGEKIEIKLSQYN